MGSNENIKRSAGIITFQWYDNFGTLFQAYALQETLVALGFDAHIIPLSGSKNTGVRRFLAKTPRGIFEKARKFIEFNGLAYERGFERFREKFFRRAGYSPIPIFDVIGKEFVEDVMVFGSDNIWSVGSLPMDYRGFDIFFGNGIKHGNKVVYGASTAGYLERHRYCQQIIERIGNGGFRKISCREQYTTDLLRSHGIDSVTVPDPVLLIEKDLWLRLLEPPADNGYVLGYDIGHEGDSEIGALSVAIGKSRRCKTYLPYPHRFFKYGREAVYPSPQQWLGLFNNAGLIVTNSFHGIAFSLVFNRDFIYVPISGKASPLNMRVNELLKRVGLMDRIASGRLDPDVILKLKQIDWPEVNRRIGEFQNEGLSYLRSI